MIVIDLNVRMLAARTLEGFAGGLLRWTRTLHNGVLHRGQSGRPFVLSNDEWPRLVSGIFRLQKVRRKRDCLSATRRI